ncbi:hypothetical protein ACIVBQ_001351 [Tenacibaculum discolor]
MLQIAEKHVEELGEKAGIPTILYYDDIIKKPYGNIYDFTSKKFFETQEEKYAVLGDAPFLVENETGKVISFGTAYPLEYYIDLYEKGLFIPALDGVWEYKELD